MVNALENGQKINLEETLRRNYDIASFARRQTFADVYSQRSLTDWEVLDVSRKIVFYDLSASYAEEDRDQPIGIKGDNLRTDIPRLERIYGDTTRGDYRSTGSYISDYPLGKFPDETDVTVLDQELKNLSKRLPRERGEVLPKLHYPWNDPYWVEEYGRELERQGAQLRTQELLFLTHQHL